MSKKIVINQQQLYQLYIIDNLGVEECADFFNVSVPTINRNLKKFNIKKPFNLRTEIIRRRGGFKFGKERQEKIRETCKQKYGVDNPSKVKQFQEKRLNTFRTRYGVDNASQISGHLEKYRQTSLERYGVDNYNKKHIPQKTREIFSSKKNLEQFLKDNPNKTFYELVDMLGVSYRFIENYIHEWGLTFLIKFYPSDSKVERELRDLLLSWNIDIKTRDRSVLGQYELDIYAPSNNFAIEYNGVYWHNAKIKSNLYHQQKSLLCEQNGIQLFHIFEYEWEDNRKRHIILEMLKNKLKINRTVIYARQCELLELSYEIKRNFLNANHLQGDDHASIRYGLFYKGTLVSVMTFTKPRFNRSYDWELSRYACKAGYNVVGGASKLFKHFLSKHTGTIISYSDIAKTNGKLYEVLGFKFSHFSKPSYVWCNRHTYEIKSRFQCQMKNESKIMSEKGWFKIYDCGNKVWSYKNN